MVTKASGTFDVTLSAVSIDDSFDEDLFHQMKIEKKIAGDLQGTSNGQMLACHTNTEGSAGYVAIEQISGTLAGKAGSFVVQHSCFMGGGNERQSLEIIPDSGTGELVGVEGTMEIQRTDEGHTYELRYSLPS